jgi:hypothetical protein
MRARAYHAQSRADAGTALGPERLYVVPADAKRVEVLYGTFADRGEASTALAALPASLTQFRPFIRSLDGVREDARRATARP